MGTEERLARLEGLRDWIMEIRDGLGLTHWTIRLSADPPDDETYIAVFHRRKGQIDGRIYFSDQFFAETPEEQRVTIVHELLHAHFRAVWEAWYDLDGVLGKAAYEVLSYQMYNAEELAVDAISRAVASRFPLPPAPAPDQPERPTMTIRKAGEQAVGEAIGDPPVGNDICRWYEGVTNRCARCGAEWRATRDSGYTLRFTDDGPLFASTCPGCGYPIATLKGDR